MKKRTIVFTCLFLLLLSTSLTNWVQAGNVTILDAKHYSNVFGEIRNYRIFLPPGYYDNPQKKYPVIYFLHGWDQRYFGSGTRDYGEYEKGDDNKGDNIAKFVSTHDVIVVKSDGYNRNPDAEYYVRPYNIGEKSEVETYRQFPVYYPELVNFIDDSYNTISDREHRAISGLSMGGFMTFWIGGKYPHLFSAAGSFCGSAEFMVGPQSYPVEYRHIDMYKNYGGMNVRLNYGNKDFIRGYHQDLNNTWTQVMDNYEYKVYEGEHSTCGLGEMFEFFLKTFENPPQKPKKWSHADVYPVFSVWDYEVNSDRNLPGFTILENVDKRGFRCSVREFLPDGELFPFVNVKLTTPPIYEKNQLYIINDVDTKSLKSVQKTIRSDNSGRLKISMNGNVHEIGINLKIDKPNICISSFAIGNTGWATPGKDIRLSVKLLNKGLADGKNISTKISARRGNTEIVLNESTFGSINVNGVSNCKIPYVFHIKSDSVEIVQFKLTIQDSQKNQWSELFEVPVRRQMAEIKDFVIADGKTITVAKAGIGSETVLLGHGNGDGVANPGESIVILVKDKDTYRRTNLMFSDKYVNPFGVNKRESDSWMKFDDVGASNKYTVPLIASDCPENHKIEFFAEYWLPDYPLHIVKQGHLNIEVKGEDRTAPKLNWVKIPGDNIIHVKLYDGSKIQSVKARLILKVKPEKKIEMELKDDGLRGDEVDSDNVFSAKIPEQKFGLFSVEIEATDSFGNKLIEKSPDIFVLH